MTTAVAYGHVEPVTVFFDDLDAMGLVHNAKYAVLLERALTPWWADRGHAFDGAGPAPFFAVREFTISYRTPIRGTGTVHVHFWLDEVGNTSGVYGFRFLSPHGGTVYAEGRRVVVRIDRATLRPVPWSDDTRAVAEELRRP
jgi:acyl-CoA thioester hydrolase